MASLNSLSCKSMQSRGNNGNVVGKVIIQRNHTNGQIIQACQQAQQATGRPVYLVGAISSLNSNGAKVSMPANWHYRLRKTFKVVANVMLNNKVWACNPASAKVFGRHIKAPKAIRNSCKLHSCPTMANNQMAATSHMLNGGYAFKCLQRANKNYARTACAIVLVNAPLALNSNGVQQELKFALKYNPNAKVYQWHQNIGPMAKLVNKNLSQLAKLGCTIIK
jgi:hypothetical protein